MNVGVFQIGNPDTAKSASSKNQRFAGHTRTEKDNLRGNPLRHISGKFHIAAKGVRQKESGKKSDEESDRSVRKPPSPPRTSPLAGECVGTHSTVERSSGASFGVGWGWAWGSQS